MSSSPLSPVGAGAAAGIVANLEARVSESRWTCSCDALLGENSGVVDRNGCCAEAIAGVGAGLLNKPVEDGSFG